MPTALGDRFSPLFDGFPPHMSAEDRAIWLRWWPTVREKVVDVYYDVGLGLPEDLPLEVDPIQLAGWIFSNQKRADLVALAAKEIWIVELRHNASANAIGRLQMYSQLWSEDPVLTGVVKLILVLDREDSALRFLARRLGIEMVAV